MLSIGDPLSFQKRYTPPDPSETEEISEGFTAFTLRVLSSKLFLILLKVFENENAEKKRINKKNAEHEIHAVGFDKKKKIKECSLY